MHFSSPTDSSSSRGVLSEVHPLQARAEERKSEELEQRDGKEGKTSSDSTYGSTGTSLCLQEKRKNSSEKERAQAVHDITREQKNDKDVPYLSVYPYTRIYAYMSI